ncbi:hypothetical protein [Flavobacterium terrae]|uniref:Sel1 repeat-containing protein n=1 Tax=Flavobacterium terrae TaxID=415425 RepID=A0A1M6CVI1_9FLAO|nr:hypothetical protein [Flavobacterium terrae]SHI64969.1 hypothetical protein SAMN05444363_1117 [Flavobacterium terrae]
MKSVLRVPLKVLILISILYSCNKKDKIERSEYEEKSNTFSFYNKEFINANKIENLKKTIEIKGDTIAFLELEEIYFNSGHRDEFLYYAIFMANAYDYSGAYYTCYKILHTDFGKEKYKMNDKLANYYLLKANEKGSKSSTYNIKERFPNGKIPSSEEYWKSIIK